MYAQVLVEVEPAHLDRPFDYRVPDEPEHPVQVGSRVEVVFSGRRRRGVVVGLADHTDVEAGRVRELRRVLGPHAWMTREELELARWAGERFAAPTADVIRHALPGRVVDVERRAEAAGWFPPGRGARPGAPPAPDEDAEVAWQPYGRPGGRLRAACADGAGAFYWRPLPGEDVGRRLVELATAALAGDRDVLVVVPDVASAVADTLVEAFGDLAVDARGGPSPRRAYRLWLRARCGLARVVVGERSVALWPLTRLGLAVVVDEANPALKERRSPRHHAREVVLERARRTGGVGLLVGTVPSAGGWRLLREQRVIPVTPTRDRERAAAPLVQVAGPDAARTRISRDAMTALRTAIRAGAYGVVLAARRGEGRALACTGCGRRLACPTCDASLASAGAAGRAGAVVCSSCGWRGDRVACRGCGARRFVPLAAGAQRLGAELTRSLEAPVAVLEGYDQPAPPPPAVLVTTRGSVLDTPPGPVGAVVLGDLDGQLRRPTLDASEDTLRLAMQVAAWTVTPARDGSAEAPSVGGQGNSRPVIVQSAEPDHPVVQALVRWDPGGFWRAEATTRAALRFPPAAHAVRLTVAGDAGQVVAQLRSALPDGDEVLGPLPSTDGEQAGLLVKADDRVATLAALAPLRAAWSQAGTEVRVDVDPVD